MASQELKEEFFIIDDNKIESAIIYWRNDNGWLKGSVYPISITDPEEFVNGEGFYFISKTSSDEVEKRIDGKINFDFIFRWRGVWESRLYFKQEEYWGEELPMMTAQWAIIEQQLKQFLRATDPGNKYMLSDD